MAFGDLTAQLTGLLPGISPILAETFINNAWRKVRDRRPWGFLSRDAVVICPAQITSGSFAITQYSATVVGDADARLAFDGITAPALTALQIRFMGLATTSEIYSITAADVATPAQITLTLDRVVQEATNATSDYLAYRCYITPPDSSFAQWESLVDMENAITIGGDRLSYSSAYFDVRDPQRQSLGQAYYCGRFKANTTTAADRQSPIYELWPGPTEGQTFYTRWRSRGEDFSDPGDLLPTIIPDDLIVDLALLHWAYPHVQANIGHFPMMAKTNWTALFTEKRMTIYGNKPAGIRGSIFDAMINDDTQQLQSVYNRGHRLTPSGPAGFYGPVDSNFIQRHPITWMWMT